MQEGKHFGVFEYTTVPNRAVVVECLVATALVGDVCMCLWGGGGGEQKIVNCELCWKQKTALQLL